MTEHLDKTRRYYDDFSRDYERARHEGYHALIDDLSIEILAPLVQDRRVLEIGCGTGLLLSRIAELADEAVGVDLSPGMLEQARARGLEVVEGSATALPFEDASFDLAFSFKVLAHVEPIEAALREAARVVRPGGHVVVDVYNRWSLRYLARQISGARSIGKAHREDDIVTRWDSPREAIARLPPTLELESAAGVRVVTPAAGLHRVPVLRSVLGRAERASVHSPLRWLGGFLVLVLRRGCQPKNTPL
ncbi:MAG: methyltransferase domain-containing protein [Sandaracinaceae bacterium]|nr:methyltransferase domain-containing protein [Sandaracinaceae bacterium]